MVVNFNKLGYVRKLKSQFEQVERALAFWRVLMGLISAG